MNSKVLVVAVATIALATPAGAQLVDPAFPMTDGEVYASAIDGNTLYLGGFFSFVGPYMGGHVALDANTGDANASWPKVAGQVLTCAADGAGGWYIGGTFTSVHGVPRVNLAHILADGSVSPWNPGALGGGPNGYVRTIVVTDSLVYVGGLFSLVGNQTRFYLAAVDAVTGAATSWNPGADNAVWSLAVVGSTVYAGGFFSTIGGQPRTGLAAINASDGIVTLWDPALNPFSSVLSLATSGSTLYVGGQFSSIGGESRNNLAAIDTGTGLPTLWNPNSNGGVLGMIPNGKTMYLWGNFQTIGGQSRNCIAQLSLIDGLATLWDPAPDHFFSPVGSIAVDGTTVYVGGDFMGIGGQPRAFIAALDGTTGLATSWSPRLNGRVDALGVSGGTVYAGGALTSVGGVNRNYIAAIDLITGLPTTWNPNANQTVRGLAVSAGTVYAGGSFTSIGGENRSHIAALDAATGLATGWDPGPTNADVFTVAVSESVVYAGGYFQFIGGQNRNRIAALDISSGLATPWNPGANDYVSAMVVNGSTIYVGGAFTSAGGLSRSRLAALDASSNTALPWNPSANSDIRALALSDSIVYVAGHFFSSSIGGKIRNFIAAVDATSGLATSWYPVPNAYVGALAVSGSQVYLGGQFTTINGQPRKLLAAIDAETGLPTAWNPGAAGDPFNTMNTLLTSGSRVYAGGRYNTMSEQTRAGIASIEANATTLASTVVAPNGGEALNVGSQALLQWSGSGGHGVATVDLYLSRNGAAGPWESLAYGLIDTGSHDWVVTGPSVTGNVYLRVDVRDWLGNVASDVSDAGFSIGPVASAPETGPVTAFALGPIVPHPTRGVGQLSFAVPQRARVRIALLDVQGRQVAVLHDGVVEPGRHVTALDARRLPAGLYFARLQAPAVDLTRRVVMIR